MKPTTKDPNTVGVRELKQHLSYHLRRVQLGHSIHITSHGRTIVTMQPALPNEVSIDPDVKALLAAGYRWSGKRPVFPRPGMKIKGGPMSDTVLEDRR